MNCPEAEATAGVELLNHPIDVAQTAICLTLKVVRFVGQYPSVRLSFPLPAPHHVSTIAVWYPDVEQLSW